MASTDPAFLSGSFALRHGYYVSASVPFNATVDEVSRQTFLEGRVVQLQHSTSKTTDAVSPPITSPLFFFAAVAIKFQEALAGIPSLGGGIVAREAYYDSTSGLEGEQYTITFAYSIGDLASLSVVTDGLSGVGISVTVEEVSCHSRTSPC